MKIFIFLVFIFFMHSYCSFAQQYMLYNSRTLYDAFENPSQKAFYADSSFKYAFNLFIPTIVANGSANGPANDFFRKKLFENTTDISSISAMETKANILEANFNIYLAMFRVFTDVRLCREVGASWQIRNDTHGELANAFIIISQGNNPFAEGRNNIYALNSSSYTQSYHQFSFTYRRNSLQDKKVAWGVKLSYLSGINYNAVEMQDAYLNRNNDNLTLHATGFVRSNHSYKSSTQEDVESWLLPGFKNPGFSFTLSTNFKLRKEWYVMTNLKDIGFINWSDGYEYRANPFNFQFFPIAPNASLASSVRDQLENSLKRKSFTTPTNGKFEVLVNKNWESYQPNLIVSKNLFYSGWDMVLVNNYQLKNLVLSASAGYNPDTSFQLGGQLMIKSPNFEFYLGSNQVLGTYQNVKGLIDRNLSNGADIGASVYFGLGIKFGSVVYHRANSPYVPVNN